MNGADFLLDARRLWAGEVAFRGPLALVDLDATAEWPDAVALPPCPVIGLGNAAHPLAAALDAVIEQPVSRDALVAQVLAQPAAAAVIAELLRALPGMSVEQGLLAESLAYGVLQAGEGHARWLAGQAVPRPGAPGRLDVALADGVLALTLDRAPADNAIDRPLRDALHEAFATAALDPSIATVRLRARGRSFSLGADLAEFGTTRDAAAAHVIRRLTLPARMIARCAERLEVHVQGPCVGAGLEMAAFARRITATSRAWFQLPELAMGVLPGAGGCVSLSRRIGRQRAALMILSGRRISAEVALRWGLVDALVSDGPGDQGGANIIG
jgi:enoyl-CoA hydratase/carnithine racemase